MTLSEMVELARVKDIPLKRSGVFSTPQGFNQKFIDDKFWKAEEFYYKAKLLGVMTEVKMKVAPEWPRRLYEIRVRFFGSTHDQQFNSEVFRILNEKYGRASIFEPNIYREYKWAPDKNSKITLTTSVSPVITYTDTKLEAFVIYRKSYDYQNEKHGYSKKDKGKF